MYLIPLNYLIFRNFYKSKKLDIFYILQFFLTLLLILIPLIINPDEYHPAHLIHKTYGLITFESSKWIIFLIICLIIIFYFLFKKINFSKFNLFKSAPLIQCFIYILPLSLIIILTLSFRLTNNSIKYWEGLSYLILIYPCIIFFISNYFKSQNILKNKSFNDNIDK